MLGRQFAAEKYSFPGKVCSRISSPTPRLVSQRGLGPQWRRGGSAGKQAFRVFLRKLSRPIAPCWPSPRFAWLSRFQAERKSFVTSRGGGFWASALRSRPSVSGSPPPNLFSFSLAPIRQSEYRYLCCHRDASSGFFISVRGPPGLPPWRALFFGTGRGL